jgi:hypothetical protein
MPKQQGQDTQTGQDKDPQTQHQIQPPIQEMRAEVDTPVKATLAGTVAQYIGAVMEDPVAMRALEAHVLAFINNDDKTPEKKIQLLQQLVRGRQAMESIHSLFYQGY